MVKRSQEDWDSWIERIVENYSDMIMRIAMHQVSHRSEAEDITQKVFLKLIQKQPEFRCKEHEKAWIIRVTINFCKDYFKSSWFNKVIPFKKENVAVFSPQEDCLLQQEEDLLPIIHKLPQNYKNVIYMYYYEGLNVSEISKIINTKEGTVMSWLYRAREKLKFLMEGEYSDE